MLLSKRLEINHKTYLHTQRETHLHTQRETYLHTQRVLYLYIMENKVKKIKCSGLTDVFN